MNADKQIAGISNKHEPAGTPAIRAHVDSRLIPDLRLSAEICGN